MLIRRIAGCTQTIGADQGYNALPIRQRVTLTKIENHVHEIVATECAFEPTPDELTRLNNGESVIVQLLLFGNLWPPIQVYVDEGKAAVEDDPLMGRLIRVHAIMTAFQHAAEESEMTEERQEALLILESILHDLKID